MVGALQYLTMTSPDIVFAVHVVFQFMHASRTSHLYVVKHIFTYLQGTLDPGLWFHPTSSPTLIVAYFDADLTGGKDFYHVLLQDMLGQTLLPGTPRSSKLCPSPPLRLSIGD